MTGKRILSCVLSVVLLVSSCVIGAYADDGTSAFISQAADHKADWEANGRNGKTTLFIGDSFFSKNFWTDFYDTYKGKDVLRAGIGSTTTYDWDVFIDSYLAYTNPKNIVMHMGTNNIHNDGDDAATASANLQNLFTKMHALENLADTQIYYFGIPYKKSTVYGDGEQFAESVKTTIDTVNANMETWCAERDWITYLGDLTGGAVADSQFRDNTHLTLEAYRLIVDALDKSDIGIEDQGDVTCVVGDANYDETFDVTDLIRLKLYLAGESVDCSLDADLNVSGALNDPDAVRCREMLVGDPALQVTVTEDGWYKRLQSTDNYYVYYELNKAVKAGRTITFDVIFPEGADYTAYVYYAGCDDWQLITDADTTADNLQCEILASEDISTVRVKVVNNTDDTIVSDYKIYDIQVTKTAVSRKLTDLAITYNLSTAAPVLYGTSDTLDMTRFAVSTETEGLDFEWTLKKGNTVLDLDMTNTAFTFDEAVTYTLTATETTTGSSASMSIYVVDPSVYVDYEGGTVANTVSGSTVTAGAYNMDALKSATSFVSTSEVSYVAGLGGTANGAMVTNHYTGPYTVIDGYEFGTGDFVVSAWINIPSDAELSTGGTSFLFGTMNPDGKDGFAISLKEQALRIKVLGNSANSPDVSFERDTWYNVSVQRKGTAFTIYFNGKNIKSYTINETDSFGTKSLALGAYYGPTYAYKDSAMYYDDVQIYNNALNLDKIKAIANSNVTSPEVRVDYDDGTVVNSGANSAITAGAYTMNALKSATSFVSISDISYVTGVGGTSKAMVTNHYTGPYTVVKNYNFGTGDFTISTWFNMPGDAEVSAGSSTLLFGTDNPDTTTKFAMGLKATQLRFRLAGTTNFVDISYEKDTWYNLTLTRQGTVVNVYFDGTLLKTYSIAEGYDFGTADLAFGAYYGVSWAYKDANMYYDEIEVYNTALSASQINEICAQDEIDLNVSIDFTDGTVENTGKLSGLLLGTYAFNDASVPDYLKPANATYTSGVAGDENGAISINHRTGAYASVQDYNLGTNNFTASTWFNVPGTETVGVTGTYLIGNAHPDAATGFSICLKYSSSTGYELRVRVDGSNKMYGFSTETIEFAQDTWYYLTVVREGADFNIYVNGTLFATKTATATTDLGVDDLTIGAYPGFGSAYTAGTNTYFDGVKVYAAALTPGKIAADMTTDLVAQ